MQGKKTVFNLVLGILLFILITGSGAYYWGAIRQNKNSEYMGMSTQSVGPLSSPEMGFQKYISNKLSYGFSYPDSDGSLEGREDGDS